MPHTIKDATVNIIVDDAEMLSSLSALLGSAGMQTRIFHSAEAFLKVFDRDEPGVLLLSLHLPGLGGLELQAYLNEINASIPILFVSATANVAVAVQALRAGAYDFIEDPANSERILESVREILAVLANRPMPLPSKTVVAHRLGNLTEREREVLSHLLDGKMNKEIADALGVSRRTIEVHRARIREKMQARGIADLLRMMG